MMSPGLTALCYHCLTNPYEPSCLFISEVTKYFDFILPDGTRYKHYQCEGQSLEISCDSDQTIKIQKAIFGRFSIAICNPQAVLSTPGKPRIQKSERCQDRASHQAQSEQDA